jgi:hypothetical protein
MLYISPQLHPQDAIGMPYVLINKDYFYGKKFRGKI